MSGTWTARRPMGSWPRIPWSPLRSGVPRANSTSRGSRLRVARKWNCSATSSYSKIVQPSAPMRSFARVTIVLSTTSTSSVELSAWLTSPRARNSPTDLVSLACPRLELLEQTHILNGDDRLIGEGLQKLYLLFGERLYFPSPDLYTADAHALSQQGHAQDCPVPEPTGKGASFRKLFGFLLKISHVNHLPLEHRTASHRSADQRQCELSNRPGWNRAVMSDEKQRVAVYAEDTAIGRLTETSRSLGHGVEHGLD